MEASVSISFSYCCYYVITIIATFNALFNLALSCTKKESMKEYFTMVYKEQSLTGVKIKVYLPDHDLVNVVANWL